MTYKVGDNVEWQPPTGGSSKAVRIIEVVGNENIYFTADDKMIRHADILGLNFKTK